MRLPLIPTNLAGSFVCCSLLFLCGCSKHDPAAVGPVAGATPNLQAALSTAGQRAAVTAALPQADASVPLEQYVSVTSGNQLMFLYYGLINLPVDYVKAVRAYSNDYRSTNDEFRKKDILEALKPRIDAEITGSKQHRYFSVETRTGMGHYDFGTKGFPVNGLVSGSAYGYFNDNGEYRYSFTNADSFKLLRVPDEAQARRLEDLVQRGTAFTLRVYAFAQDVDPNQQIVKSQIVKMRLLDQRGEDLAAQ